MAKRFIDLTGQRFERLLIIKRAQHDRHGHARWHYKCDCGNIGIVGAAELRVGKSKSCGCYKLSLMAKVTLRHGMAGTKTYNIWKDMRKRCRNRACDAFPHYGGRGIKVCNRWQIFENFFANMGACPSDLHSIERKDVNGNYEKNNCVWLLLRKQGRNKRLTLRVDGVPLADLCEERGLRYGLVYDRIKRLGWNIQRALTEMPNG